MADDTQSEVIDYKPSHRLFQVSRSYPLSRVYPTKKGRKRFKKEAKMIEANLLGLPAEQPMEQPSKREPSKNNRQKYARRARRRAG